MYILSQDKTRIYNMSGHIEGIGYEESKDYKQRKTENIRHTIQVFDGCAEEIAEFKTKEASRGKAKYNIRNSGGYRLKEPLQNHHSERMKSQRK